MYLPVQGREKIELIQTFTEMGFDILVSDVDCVWCALIVDVHCGTAHGLPCILRPTTRCTGCRTLCPTWQSIRRRRS